MIYARITVIALLCAGLMSAALPASGQSVTLSSTVLNFGNVVVGSTSTKSITVKNSGSATLVFSSIGVSSGFSQTNNCIQLAPTKSCTITVTFAPTAYIAYSGTLTISDNGGTGTQTATLTGTGVVPVRVPSTLSFTAVMGTTSPPTTAKVVNNQSVMLNISSISISGPFNLTSASTCAGQVLPSSSCSLSITYTATAVSQQNGSVTITDDASNSPSVIALAGYGKAVVLTSVGVSPNSATVSKGAQQQFVATGYYNNNTTQDLTGTASWSSSATSVASVGNSSGSKGLVTALSQGSSTITAASGTIKGSASLAVSAPSLVSIAVSPANSTVPLGSAQQFAATGTYSDGSTADLTSAVAWQSNNPAVATVSAAGLASGIAQGAATISATYGTVSGSTLLTIAPAALVTIALTPKTPSIALGTTQQFTATGTYSDGSTLDLTQQVTWNASSAAATISNASGTQGLAQGTAMGTATITASLGSITGTALLVVTPAALVSITISPVNPTIAQGLKQQCTALGTFTDNSTQDITATVTWNSSSPLVASISNTPGSQGQASALSPGSADITANSGTVVSNVSTLTVQPPALLSITISPPAPFIAIGTTQQLIAAGNYSDGSTQDLTGSVVWASSDPSVADVSNAAGTQGLLTASSTGTLTITATSASISANDIVVITPGAISSIAIIPSSASIPLGSSQQFTATATFSDGTTQDVTSTAHWSAGDGSVATISNSSPGMGLASTVSEGSVTIAATAGGVTGYATLVVNAASLVSLTVTPSNASVLIGGTQLFTATGSYSDNSTQDLTTMVNWSTYPNGVASVSNTPGTQGQTIGVAQGNTVITATQGSIIGSATLNVAAVTLPCGGPLTYCAPTSVAPLPIPDNPPTVSTIDPFTGKGTMFTTPWSNSVAMRLTDGTTSGRKSSFGLFYNGQSDPAVRSPMLGARASQNCNHGSPTCYYMRVIVSGAGPKFIWVDGGSHPTQGNWQSGDLCVDNPHYTITNGYGLFSTAYNYGARTGPTWHAPKFLQTPGSEGIVLDVELRTPAGARNGGLTGDDAWLVARDLTTCSSTVDVHESPVVDFSSLYPAFDPTHTMETQGYGPAFTESTASALSNNGVVSLQSGIYCVTLSTYTGDDNHGTAVVCYDASLGKGHWFDTISGTVGPDVGGWGQSGLATTTCATSTCLPMGIYISALHMNFGLTPYLKLEMTNHVFWDMQGLNFTMVVHNGLNERVAMDHVIADSLNQFSAWPLLDYSKRAPLTFPAPLGWGKPSNYSNKLVYPGGLYYISNQIAFTGTGDPGVAFISASNNDSVVPCVHDVGGTCGIYGVALDGSGTEYSFFPHFASMQQGGTPDTVKSNLSAYIDSAGFTWIYWGSDWMGNLGCSDGVTAYNCSAAGTKNRADVFAAVVQ